jgi:hypothetical protein
MPTPFWTRIIILLTAVVWFITSIVMGLPASSSWFRPLGITTSIVVFFLFFFDIYFWRVLPHSFSKMPNIRGTWKAELNSSFKEKGKSVKLVCFIVIRQSYSKVFVEMLYPASESYSTSANIEKTNGVYELWYSYRSTAHSLSRDGNPPHYGAARLRISVGSKPKLSGDYWTDRNTKGRLDSISRTHRIASNYEEASEMFKPS